MAVLTGADYKELRKSVYTTSNGKEELKALASLPTEAQLLGAFQSLENDLVAAFSTMKTNVETALGRSITVGLAQKIMAAYLVWKLRKLRGQ